jgi:uncharacterized membrane protein YgdD (TMEM256/DUF423 family)
LEIGYLIKPSRFGVWLKVGLFLNDIKETYFFLAGWGFLIGIVLFSGSLYVFAITNMKWLGVITPFGGVAFLFGWFWLIWTLGKGHF